MTTRSGPGHGPPGPGPNAIASARPLINLAYRFLGALAEAEEAVQETYDRICLSLPGSAQARREKYTCEWPPKPLPAQAEGSTGQQGGTTIDPVDRITFGESVTMACLVSCEDHRIKSRRPRGEVASVPGTT